MQDFSLAQLHHARRFWFTGSEIWIEVHRSLPVWVDPGFALGLWLHRAAPVLGLSQVHQKHKDLAMNDYLPFIPSDTTMRKEKEKIVKLFMVVGVEGELFNTSCGGP
ncbi:hypothetical protein L6452_03957 [Arctium lappa]|uniref:Uncharacterized protein n=1 Tax=Arctium lappa TaxID=4217 RepID=A0ACB9FN39_ARCLA|nr:hypothetical protein L6452_03957 [Arctium lappa]